jgi:hypothetical protein
MSQNNTVNCRRSLSLLSPAVMGTDEFAKLALPPQPDVSVEQNPMPVPRCGKNSCGTFGLCIGATRIVGRGGGRKPSRSAEEEANAGYRGNADVPSRRFGRRGSAARPHRPGRAGVADRTANAL